MVIELKRLASIIDSGSSISTLEFFKSKGVRNYRTFLINLDSIDLDEHQIIFKNLISNLEFIQEIYNYLCERSKNPSGYDLQRLIEQIDVYRENQTSFVVDVSEEISKLNQNSESISKFLTDLNETKAINNAFDRLNIGEFNQISILEIFKVLVLYYQDADKYKILNYMRLIDNKVQGYISYEQFNKTMKKFIEKYQCSTFLHSKFLAKKILNEHGNYNEFLNFKNLNPNSILKEKELYETFKEEFLKDEELSRRIFQNLKETTGKNVDMVIVQNFIDFISHSSSSKITKMEDTDKRALSNKSEINESIESILEKLENSKNNPLRTIYDSLNIKNINQYGKINTDIINTILKEKFPIKEEFINKFTNFFS